MNARRITHERRIELETRIARLRTVFGPGCSLTVEDIARLEDSAARFHRKLAIHETMGWPYTLDWPYNPAL